MAMNSTVDLNLFRRRFAAGETLPAREIPAEIERSWHRSRAAGLTPYSRRLDREPPTRYQIEQTVEQNRWLVQHLAPEMQLLWECLSDPRWTVLCIDGSGLIIHNFNAKNASDPALRPLYVGRQILENEVGTTAPSCVLQTSQAFVIHGNQHYLSELDRFFCAAVPIHHPDGQLLAALDVTGVDREPPLWLQERLSLVAISIENRLFQELPDCSLLHVHHDPRLLGTPLEGIVAVNSDGTIRQANATARSLLGLSPEVLGQRQVHLQELLAQQNPRALERLRAFPEETAPLPLVSGTSLYARLHRPAASRPTGKTSQPIECSEPAAQVPFSDEPELRKAFEMARKTFNGGVPILLQGETGVGKEVFTRALHDALDPTRPFVAINCSAIPANLIESELFGYSDGAFTGGRKGGAIGKIEQANGGTLFLDEIGDMPAELQTRLLRVLQERCLTRLGDHRSVPIDVRLVSASHRDLESLIEHEGFREDLFYRINGLRIVLPPLRARQDVPQLVERLLAEMSPTVRTPKRLSDRALRAVLDYRWPGNVRQLQQALKVAVILSEDEPVIEIEHFPPDLQRTLRPAQPGTPDSGGAACLEDNRTLQSIEMEAIQQALRRNGGNLSATAKELKISRSTLYKKLQGA